MERINGLTNCNSMEWLSCSINFTTHVLFFSNLILFISNRNVLVLSSYVHRDIQHKNINHKVGKDKTIKDESRVSSFDAPITSPEIPPKVLFDVNSIIVAIVADMPSDRKPA